MRVGCFCLFCHYFFRASSFPRSLCPVHVYLLFLSLVCLSVIYVSVRPRHDSFTTLSTKHTYFCYLYLSVSLPLQITSMLGAQTRTRDRSCLFIFISLFLTVYTLNCPSIDTIILSCTLFRLIPRRYSFVYVTLVLDPCGSLHLFCIYLPTHLHPYDLFTT